MVQETLLLCLPAGNLMVLDTSTGDCGSHSIHIKGLKDCKLVCYSLAFS